MASIKDIINGVKNTLGMNEGPAVETIGEHRVSYDEAHDEFYCLRCYQEGETKRHFVESECDAPEMEHDIVPYYPDDNQESGIDAILTGGNQGRRRRPDPDGFICTRCEKWAESKEALADRSCDPY